jgi:hypothetical protein
LICVARLLLQWRVIVGMVMTATCLGAGIIVAVVTYIITD